MHVVHASFDPDAVRASCDNYDPTWLLSILALHRIIWRVKSIPKARKEKAKIGRNRPNFALSMQKKVQQLEKYNTAGDGVAD